MKKLISKFPILTTEETFENCIACNSQGSGDSRIFACFCNLMDPEADLHDIMMMQTAFDVMINPTIYERA